MNGKQHMAAAVEYLEAANGSQFVTHQANRIAAAQVHATLALAMATLAQSNRVPAEFWGGRDEPAPED